MAIGCLGKPGPGEKPGLQDGLKQQGNEFSSLIPAALGSSFIFSASWHIFSVPEVGSYGKNGVFGAPCRDPKGPSLEGERGIQHHSGRP